MESLFCCPVCGGALAREPGRYLCAGGHSFDLAREGYVHLLPANRKHAKNPGDDRDMAAARNRFLSGGYYAPLREKLEALALARFPAGGAVLDAGCGEGYYTAGLYQALSGAGLDPRLAGVDLSKPSVRLAARRVPAGELAVASVYHLPLGDGRVDLLLDCFSPLALEEFRRVLRPGGVFLYVVPGAEHLWELKQVLYDRPYYNKEEDIPYQGFAYEDVVPVKYSVAVAGEALADLFRMTPYYWRTPKAGSVCLAAQERLDITAHFRIHMFRRTP